MGCQRLQSTLKVNKNDVLSKLNFPLASGEKIAVLATNPIDPELRRLLTREFCETLSRVLGWKGVIRLHQSESLDIYHTILKSYPFITFLENAVLSLEESIALADVVISHNSGYADDAVLYGVPVGIFDILPLPLLSTQNLIDHKVAVLLKSAEEFRVFLIRFRESGSYSQELAAHIARYKSLFCVAYDLDAVDNIVNVLHELVDISICRDSKVIEEVNPLFPEIK